MKNLVKELQMRLFALRVLFAIYANKAISLGQPIARGIGRGVTRGIGQPITRGIGRGIESSLGLLQKKLSQILTKVSSQVSTEVSQRNRAAHSRSLAPQAAHSRSLAPQAAHSRSLAPQAARTQNQTQGWQVVKFLTKSFVKLFVKFLAILLVKFLAVFSVARSLLPALVKVARIGSLTSARLLRKGCLKHPRLAVGTALLSLCLVFLNLAEPNLEANDANASTMAPEPRLSLLPQILPTTPPRPTTQTALPSRTEYRTIDHSIRSSLYQTAFEHGIELPLLRRFLDVMSYDVDFQREIWAGARFRMLLSQQFRLGEGGSWLPLKEPVLEMAELYTGRKLYSYYRSGWNEAFYDKKGSPAKRLLRRTPMSGLRLTSRFGLRRHPILGYTRMHKGTDFAAPRGTPILAAGDGVVRKKIHAKGYGRYVLLRHSDRLATLYAHMRSFARGLRVGTRVKQGQVIGYVGTSGVSTGPHLHYEIHRDGRAVNPRTVKLPKPKLLQESKRQAFAEKVRNDEAWLARGGSTEEGSALAALRALGCDVWGGMCDNSRRAQR